jgi:hypothetical protein
VNAQSKVAPKKDTGIINIHGKEYQSVALRVSKFREAYPNHSLTTAVLERDPECVVMQASIADEQGRVLATGHSEEYRKASQINRTSALENAETSAIGRALAALGFGGTEFATANEVQNAIHQQGNPATGEEPPAKREKLDGPYPSPSALKGAIKAFVDTLSKMQDLGEFTTWMETPDVVELEKQAMRDLPAWWETGDGMPAEFVPVSIRIHQKKRDLEEIENIHSNTRTVIDAG